MNFVTKTNMFDVVAKEIPCLTGAGAPNGLTKGAVGCLYMDKNDGMMYKCTGLVNGFYTWVVVDEMKIHIGESEPTDDRVTVWVDTDEEVEIVEEELLHYILKAVKKDEMDAEKLNEENVQLITEKLGGGGHSTMAACQLEDVSFEEALEKLKSAIDEYYEEK